MGHMFFCPKIPMLVHQSWELSKVSSCKLQVSCTVRWICLHEAFSSAENVMNRLSCNQANPRPHSKLVMQTVSNAMFRPASFQDIQKST